MPHSDQSSIAAAPLQWGFPTFASSDGEALRRALIAVEDVVHLNKLLDRVEDDWNVEWLTWINRTVVARFWENDDLAARWLCHEVALGQTESARSLAVLLKSYPADRKRSALVYDALARQAYMTGDILAGDAFMEDLEDVSITYDALWCHFARLAALDTASDPGLLNAAADIMRNYPTDTRAVMTILPIYASLGETEAITGVVQGIGGPVRLENHYLAYLYFSALEMSGQYSLTLDQAMGYLRSVPDNYPVYHIVRSVAHRLDRMDETQDVFDLPLTAESDPSAREIMILNALDCDDYDRADMLYSGFTDKSCEPALRARLTIATTVPRSRDAGAAFRAYRASDVAHAGPEIQYVAHRFGSARSDRDLRHLRDILERRADLGRSNAFFQRLRLQLMIGLGQIDNARSLLNDMPAGIAQNWHIAEVAHYLDQQNGNHDAVAAAWADRIKTADYRVLQSVSDNPSPVKVDTDAMPTGVIVFSCFYNAMEYVDWFLAHYRALGVACFVIVDNGSSDGTLDYLVRQPDVQTYSQPGSFKEAAHGVAWINHLISIHAPDRWVLFADMDECLVFPNMENGRTLDDLTRYGDAHGFAAFRSFMLDMYAPVWSNQKADFESQTFFDNDYFGFTSVTPPYRTVQGGMRARMTGRQFLITKSPLVKTRPGFLFLENNHTHTHLPVADVGTAMLHYKLIGDSEGRINDAIERREHYMAGRLYRDLKDGMQGGAVWPCLKTRRYRGPQQLTALGLMNASPAWDDWS